MQDLLDSIFIGLTFIVDAPGVLAALRPLLHIASFGAFVYNVVAKCQP